MAWWVADDHQPDFVEASERHEHLHDKGPTAEAFTFKQAFDSSGEAIEIDRERIGGLVEGEAS